MRTPFLRPVLGLLVLAAAAGACGGDSAPAEGPAVEPPPGLSPISSREPAPPPAGAPAPAAGASSGAGVEWTLPEGWSAVQPSSSMRLAQAEVPGPDGSAELTVFHFPGGAGGVEANLERWAGQMEGGGEPERGTFESDDFRVTWITLPGTYHPGTMGPGPTDPQPGWRLLAAVVEGEGGPWFFKLTGPEGTVDAARDGFFALLRSVRAAA